MVLKAYGNGWRKIWKYRWPIAFLYLANIVFTFVVTSPYTIYFKDKMEKTDLLEGDGFHLSSILEFLNNYGEGLAPLMTLLAILLLFYYLFGIYANAGILYAVVSRNSFIALRSFWTGGLNYFWKVFRLSIYFMLTLLAMASLCWVLLSASGINILEAENDDDLIMKFRIAIFIFILFSAIFFIIKLYAKIFIAAHNQPFITTAILNSGSFTFRYFGKTFLLFLVNVAVLVLTCFLILKMKALLDQNLWVLTFILAQILLLAKIILRIIHLHSCFELYLSIKSPETLSDH